MQKPCQAYVVDAGGRNGLKAGGVKWQKLLAIQEVAGIGPRSADHFIERMQAHIRRIWLHQFE